MLILFPKESHLVAVKSTFALAVYLSYDWPLMVPLLFKYPKEPYALILSVPPATLIKLSVVSDCCLTIPNQSVVETLEPSQVPEAQPLAILAHAKGSVVAAKYVLSCAISG